VKRRLLALGALLGAALAAAILGSTDGCASFGAASSPHAASPHFRDGRFVNDEPTSVMREGGGSSWKAWFTGTELRTPSCALPLGVPQLAAPPASGLRLTWLGHSSTLIELDGVAVLTDPHWSERASPSTLVGPRRFHPPPLPLEQLPRLDAVLISHDHYDHLDMATVRALARTGVAFHVGLGVGANLAAWGVPAGQIVEHDWWSTSPLPGGALLASTPARHFSGRRSPGENGTLWTSWALVGPRHRVYFSGDTGMTSAFAAIARRYGPFDVALLEIGQWHPDWGSIHLGPVGALDAFEQLQARRLLPIHWSTFQLALHAWSEPAETLVQEAARRGVTVLTPRPGESVEPETAVTGPWWRALPPQAEACPAPTAPAPRPDGWR
jgi:L-ascorbate metabolism protein UlaG (beta-lactamase superfamily)